MAITAATPMMMPSIVRTVRILFRRRARKAILIMAKYLIKGRSLKHEDEGVHFQTSSFGKTDGLMFLLDAAQFRFCIQTIIHRRITKHFAIAHDHHAFGVIRYVDFVSHHDNRDAL